MSTDVVKVIDASEIERSNVKVSEWGIEIEGEITPNVWFDVVKSIQKYDGKLQWYLGDLAVYAESDLRDWNVKKRETGKSKYDELVEGTGYQMQSMKNMARVARRFPSSWRDNFFGNVPTSVRELSFGHFDSVTSLDDNFAHYWLQKASENAWGVSRLREEIRKWKEGRGELPERVEKSIGEISFDSRAKEFFRGYLVEQDRDYDEKSWLIEVHDVIEEKLSKDYGLEL